MNYCIQLIRQGTGFRSDAITGSSAFLHKVLSSAMDDDRVDSDDLVIVIHEFESAEQEAEFSKKPIIRTSTFVDLMKTEMETSND